MARTKAPTPQHIHTPHPPLTVDAGAISAPIVKVLSALVTVGALFYGGLSAYFQILSRMDRIDERFSQQVDNLRQLSNSIRSIADEALTSGDLRAFCLQLAISNAKAGVICPFAASEPSRKARMLSPTPKAE